MAIEFKDLLNTLRLCKIQVWESNEKVLKIIENAEDVKVSTNLDIDKNSPEIEDNNLLYRLKYDFLFLSENVPYFKARYIVSISFASSDIDKTKALLADETLIDGKETINEIFVKKQLNKILWPILRSMVMDGMNRHSLSAVTLPWII